MMKSVSSKLVVDLSKSYEAYCHIVNLPSIHEMKGILDDLKDLLFPGLGFQEQYCDLSNPMTILAKLEQVRIRIRIQIYRALMSSHSEKANEHETNGDNIAFQLINDIPFIREALMKDANAILSGDPASTSLIEVLACYPGLKALTVYRIAHSLHKYGVPILPRMMSEHAHSETGIDIHPGAEIGESFMIDHGTGIVIGETAIIGDRVRIYQGVTLGAFSLSSSQIESLKHKKRHPTIQNDCIIYANAIILGGVVVGEGSVIGGNCWVYKDVAPHSRVVCVKEN